MRTSPAYVLGVLDVLVKAGEVSPAYAAGAADVLLKEAGFFFDSPSENISQQWDDFHGRNPNAYNAQTGQTRITGTQAKQMIDSARPWYTDMGGRAAANMRHWGRVAGSWLPEWMTGKQMSREESRRLLEYDRNKFRQDYLRRTNGAAPSALYGAFQDEAVRDARYARRDQKGHMSPAQLKAEFGEDEEAAANKFRTAEGMAAMRNGMYKPVYDKASAKVPTPAIQNVSKMNGLYGSKDKAKLYSQEFRNGLGMY